MLALRERSISAISSKAATLIVVYKGDSFLQYCLYASRVVYYSIMLMRVVSLSTVCSFVGLMAVMQSAAPSQTHPLMILLVFFLLYVLIFGMSAFLIFCVSWLFRRLLRGKESTGGSFLRACLYGSVVSLAPVILVAIQSVGTVNFYEVALVVSFELVAIFYVYRQGR